MARFHARQHELQRFQAGSVNLTLWNQDGRFSPWNTNGPYYNLLNPVDASQDGGDSDSSGTWGWTSNASVLTYLTPPVILDKAYTLKIVGNGGSPTTASAGRDGMGNATVYPVTAGKSYTAMCSFLTSVTARAWTVQIDWYKSDHTTLISSSVSSSVMDNTTTWTKATVAGVTAPALAAFAVITVSGASLANNEVHWICRAALFNAVANVPNTAWAPGQRGLVPARPIKCTATWSGTPYPVFYMYVDNWTPKYGQVKAEQVISATDAMKLLALANMDHSVYPGQVITDGATQLYRLGDNIGSTTALESISGDALTATDVTFGQPQPILTDSSGSATFPEIVSAVKVLTPLTGTAYSLEWWFQASAPAANEMYLFNQLGSNPGNVGQVIVAIESAGGGHPGALQVFFDSLDGTSQYGSLNGTTSLCDGAWHHVVIARNGATVTVYVDGQVYGSVAGNPFTLSTNINNTAEPAVIGGINQEGVAGITSGFAGNLANFAIYQEVYAVGVDSVESLYVGLCRVFRTRVGVTRISAMLGTTDWPSALQNIATGSSLVQPPTSSLTTLSALSYIQTIEATEQGAFYCDESGVFVYRDRHYVITASAANTSQATFANDLTAGHFHFLSQSLVPAEDDLDLWNDVPGQRQGGVLQRSQDASSIRAYQKRTLTGYTSGLQTSDNEVLDLTQWLVAHYGVPITRVRSISLDNTADAGANLPQMLGRTLLDRITISWQPIDGTTVPFDQDSLIESITHNVTQSKWVTTWQLSPAEAQSYLILNDPVYGKLSAGNRLAY